MRKIDYILIEDLENLMDRWMELLEEKEKENGKL